MNIASSPLQSIRKSIQQNYFIDAHTALTNLLKQWAPTAQQSSDITAKAIELVECIRSESKPTMMEKFLSQYSLSTEEGLALMSLAEAMLRVPDALTADLLIADKIGSGNWKQHKGASEYTLINQATWSLFLTEKVINPKSQSVLSKKITNLLKKVGEPVVRQAVSIIMKELGRQFVLGRNINEAIKNAKYYENKGYHYSYDMLGEAAKTKADADLFYNSYSNAILTLAKQCTHKDTRKNPGISIKLSALHPRYESLQKDRAIDELSSLVLALAQQAKNANMGFNIDAEEADRLDLSLDIIERVLSHSSLAGWNGFGIVVQAFSQRAPFVLDWLYALAQTHDRKIMVRLVKGAYWDSEIKHAQESGLPGFSVYTKKHHTDISYMCCAKKLFSMKDRIYPQFATHNAQSVAAILNLQEDKNCYEFQRLHGMGEALHEQIIKNNQAHCRIYAPCGEYKELLAYLVRRLLENGANSSFVNKIVDKSIPANDVVLDPIKQFKNEKNKVNIQLPSNIFSSERLNSHGWELSDEISMGNLLRERDTYINHKWKATSLINGELQSEHTVPSYNPSEPSDVIGESNYLNHHELEQAIASASAKKHKWARTSADNRHSLILKFAELLEQEAPQLFALLSREAGKTLPDAIAEIREAVDFAFYYAEQGLLLSKETQPLGVVACISPWNFPLAIFTGQVLAALVAGNVVIAKPAESTNLIAHKAVQLMHQAGFSKSCVQLVLGEGATIGNQLTSDPRVDGVCFTGSTQTAQIINQNMANNLPISAPLIAETGGLNAMIVDGTALPEQVVTDVVASAFQSAGQRCSALRMLYLQDDIADSVLEMLYGAMDELVIGNPWFLNTDVGPVIDATSKNNIEKYVESFKTKGKVLKALTTPESGNFVAPTVLDVTSINDLTHEVFGPVLHIARYKNTDLDQVISDINNRGYGLTFAIHSRIHSRVEKIKSEIKVGNIYINRNQIGAVVASQPFGGEGLSGTGPKAGGPLYVPRFRKSYGVSKPHHMSAHDSEKLVSNHTVQTALMHLSNKKPLPLNERLKHLDLPAAIAGNALVGSQRKMYGPTGEENTYCLLPKGIILCLGPDEQSLKEQVSFALAQGNKVLAIAHNASNLLMKYITSGHAITAIDAVINPECLSTLEHIDAVTASLTGDATRDYKLALSKRKGAIVPLITEKIFADRYIKERHICEDTTASGGNAHLLATS